MAGSEVKHDYHLVDPSWWPAVGSIAAFVMAIGAVAYMHTGVNADGTLTGGLFGVRGSWLLIIGAAMVVFTMIVWWADVIREHEHDGHQTPVVQVSLRYGMILFIASEVMFFLAWFWAWFNMFLFPEAHTVFNNDVGAWETMGWPPAGVEMFDPWHLPLLNTLILLTSGTTVTWAHHALQEGNRKAAIQGLWLTVLLGAAFTGVQLFEYSHAAFGFSGNIYGATFFMATGFHGFHVFIGTVFLAVCLARLYRGHFKPDQHFGFEAAAWYWHFVDVVWLFLFACIYVWGAAGVDIKPM